jgi:uncharacterized membrane protein YbhN (UPF0104 family)
MTAHEPDHDGATPAVRWLRVVAGAVVAVLVGAGVVALIGRAAGFAELTRTLRAGAPAWLAVCAAGQAVVFAGYAGAYRAAVLFEGGPRLGVRLSLRVVLATFALTQLVAAGGAAALAAVYWTFRKLGAGRHGAAVRTIGLNTLVYLVFGLVGWAAALACLLTGAVPAAMTLPWLVSIPLLLVAARWFTSPGRVEGWASPSGSWARRGLAVGVGAAWWVRRALASGDGRVGATWALAYWVGDIASLWGGLRAFDAAPALAPLALAYATGYLAQIVPVPFVATGGVDAATTYALTAVGVPLAPALLGVVAHRLFAFWLPLFPGLVLAALLPGTGRELERAASAAGVRLAHAP